MEGTSGLANASTSLAAENAGLKATVAALLAEIKALREAVAKQGQSEGVLSLPGAHHSGQALCDVVGNIMQSGASARSSAVCDYIL